MHLIYEDTHFYYLWKPFALGSNFGKRDSILDLLEKEMYVSYAQRDLNRIFSEGAVWDTDFLAELSIHGEKVQPVDNPDVVVDKLTTIFTYAQEYGMLNRLDYVTSGYVYFAKSKEGYLSWIRDGLD